MPRNGFQLVNPTVVYDMMQTCCAKTATTPAICNVARREHLCGGTENVEQTKIFLFIVNITIWKSIQVKQFATTF